MKIAGKKIDIGLMIELKRNGFYYDSVTTCHHHYTDNGRLGKVLVNE